MSGRIAASGRIASTRNTRMSGRGRIEDTEALLFWIGLSQSNGGGWLMNSSSSVLAWPASVSPPIQGVAGVTYSVGGGHSTLVDPLNVSARTPAGYGPIMTIARELRNRCKKQKVFIGIDYLNGPSDSTGTTSSITTDWKQDGSGTSYNNLVTHVNAAKTFLTNPLGATGAGYDTVRVGGMFVIHGETDANYFDGTLAAAYQANLAAWIPVFRAAVSEPTLPIIISRLGVEVVGYYNNVPTVQAAQDYVGANVANCVTVNTDGLSHQPASLGHYDEQGAIDLAGRLVPAALTLAGLP